ncbi:glycosyltransferase [Methylobacterium nigriterrae]|uniref:glycosyltransferase n=1 Tax=Methylobacterium nigriterrae TaxID=3127512 RepID=UPI0030141BDE
MLRLVREGGIVQDLALPGITTERTHWLGLVPRDVAEIRLAIDPGSGFVLERVARRSNASLFGECVVKRPLKALPALYALVRRDERRFRDILRGACAVTPLARYEAWAAARGEGATRAESHARPAIRVVIPTRAGEGRAVGRTLESLAEQAAAPWRAEVWWERGAEEAAFAPDARVTHRTWAQDRPRRGLLAGSEPVCIVRPGDVLSRDALAILAARLSEADLAYGDAEIGGRPHLKPDWSPDLALAIGYLGTPILLSQALIARLPDRPAGSLESFARDLGLAAGAAAHRVVHVPRALCRSEAVQDDAAAHADALSLHLAETGSSAQVLRREGRADLRWPLPAPAPLVSVVIPSRDRLDLIARVCRGVLHETAYPAIEVVIIDNGTTDPAVLAHYEDLRRDPRMRIRIEPAPFNFSSMVNRGVAVSSGEIVVLLNNDVAVLNPAWLDELVRQACRPEVGAVGAKLLYGDGTLQHAGVVVGLGGRAGHILRRRPGDTAGHLGRLRVAHEVSAVTAACLAVSRAKYEAVGGFDAQAFPVDFNDVDFCLRLGAAGYRTIWTPHAVLAHLESVSRGPAIGAARRRFEAEADRFVERWRATIRHDPFYHPALSLTTFGEDLE